MATLLSSLPNMDTHYLIFGGDQNCVMNTDRSSPRGTNLSKMATTLQSFMVDYGSCEPWRSLHKDTRVYYFYSHVHHAYSRIDYFFIDKVLLPSPSAGTPQWRLIGEFIAAVY